LVLAAESDEEVGDGEGKTCLDLAAETWFEVVHSKAAPIDSDQTKEGEGQRYKDFESVVMAIVGHQDEAVGFGARCAEDSKNTDLDGAHHRRLWVSAVLDRLRDGRVDDWDEGVRSGALGELMDRTRHPGRL
jgi:hypothetical protein